MFNKYKVDYDNGFLNYIHISAIAKRFGCESIKLKTDYW